MADEGHLPEWERGLLDEQAAKRRRDAALRAGRAILDAHEHGILPIGARYLADTLRMVLDATDGAGDDA